MSRKFLLATKVRASSTRAVFVVYRTLGGGRQSAQCLLLRRVSVLPRGADALGQSRAQPPLHQLDRRGVSSFRPEEHKEPRR